MRFATMLTSLLAAAVGIVIGFTSVQQAKAVTTYTVEIMGGATDYMTCGWHGVCSSSPTSGTALDWAPYTNHAIYFRSWTYRGSGSQATVARGTVDVPSGQACKSVWVHISSAAGVTYRGTEKYVHSTSTANGATIDIVATTSGFWTQSQIGSTATTENTNCPWTGEHLHQFAYWENVGGSSRNTSVYPTYVNPGYYYIDVKGYHQDRAYWSY
jgi:hypothetical protein